MKLSQEKNFVILKSQENTIPLSSEICYFDILTEITKNKQIKVTYHKKTTVKVQCMNV